MANGWPSFSQTGSSYPAAYPKNAVLDARETVWENKPESTTEYRKIQTVQIHVNCNSDSTITNFGVNYVDDLQEAQQMTNPVVKVGKTNGAVADKTLTGTWQIERVSEGHNGDGTCRIDIILVQRGTWQTA